ncbi:sigma-B regulation protein RsbU (phosphoserine phosphatase) [Reichenbachiella faecimaris]|uniref:Sigma-B regulation protein RsbU (Phosphoserine phosphatase) n=1 Tax=Reichenbachiella faecimaris TaxID=692418 RepID=A0A1W2G666_REIFA|nr:PP2C family protein-serine/threonine phosphatase [Reichenbachiella faecimaris]SMD32160.1 sigma-B regulation protein RsbU (phosphoserine phosphatase) [Reichenbachiella faecimaris]
MAETKTIESNLKELELNALLEVTEAINNNLSEESLYKIYHFTLLANLKVKKLALFVETEGVWNCKVFFGVAAEIVNGIPVDQFEGEEKVKALGKTECQEFDHVIPVMHKNQLLALVFVGDITESESGLTNNSATTFLEALTNIILVAIENKKLARQQLEQEAFKKELEIAKQVQNYLFPKNLPATDQFEVAAYYQPHHNVGGDYYDYIRIDEDQFLLCIADVSGKGVPAALMMSNFQASLHTLVRQTNDLTTIVSELNHQIKFSGNGEIFITFFVAIYSKSQQVLRYINCGHNPPLLQVNFKEDMELTQGTTVLGMFEPLPFVEMGIVENLKEFYLFCYTDGLNEAINLSEEEFGETRIMKAIKSVENSKPNELNLTMMTAVNEFRQGQEYRDDVTILSAKFKS